MRLIRMAALATVGIGSLYGNLLVSRGTQGVDQYTDSGVFLGNLIAPGAGGLQDAQGVAVAPGGDIFVGDFNTNSILRFNSSGTFLGIFASGVDVDTPFDVVFGPGGDLFVASAGPVSNITRLDHNTGAVITANFTSGNPQPLGGPQYLEFAPNNRLYVTDIAGRLFTFNATTGAWISTGFYDNPEGVAYGPDDLVYLAQRIANNVLRIPGTEVIPMGAFTGAPADIEFGPNGLLYVSASQIYRFNVSGLNGVLVDSFGTGGEFMTFTNPVPEPGTWLLAGTMLAAGIAYRRRSQFQRVKDKSDIV